MKRLYELLKWYYRETPVIAFGQDASETKTGKPQYARKYEINVSKNGKHVFATDSRIRSYTKDDIDGLVKLFETAFPDCKISVTVFLTAVGTLDN